MAQSAEAPERDPVQEGVPASVGGEGASSLAVGEIEKELRSWDEFASALGEQERLLFTEMLASSYEYIPAMQAKSSPFPVEALLVSLIFSQHKTIAKLKRKIDELKEELEV